MKIRTLLFFLFFAVASVMPGFAEFTEWQDTDYDFSNTDFIDEFENDFHVKRTGQHANAHCSVLLFFFSLFYFASPSGKIILFTKKNTTIDTPPFSTVVPIL